MKSGLLFLSLLFLSACASNSNTAAADGNDNMKSMDMKQKMERNPSKCDGSCCPRCPNK